MMKKLISRLTLSLMAATLLWSVPAQGAATHALMNAQDNSKDAKAKAELFEKFRANTTGDLNKQKSAYEAGKEYLQKYPSETDPNNKQIKEWIALYESELRGVDVLNKVYKESKYSEALQLGKPILAIDPNNIKVLTALGYAGLYTAAAGATDNTEPIGYAKKAVQLIEAGGAPTDWKPFKSKDETLGWLNYALGLMTARTTPAESIGYFTKAAMYEGAPKNDPSVYYYLAALHEQEYQDMSDNYAKTYAGKAETNDSRAAMEKILARMDLIIDAYARAIAYTDATPENTQRFQGQKPAWMEKLTTYYKFRNNKSDTGLKEMISGIRTKPLPGQPAPSTNVPLTPQTP